MTKRKAIRYDPASDLYVVLGVIPSATVVDMRRAFRLRAKDVHPDRNPDKADWAHEQFQRLNEAHDILTDPVLRIEYDEKRRQYHAGRGADGVAWWDRPNPATARPRPAPTREPGDGQPLETPPPILRKRRPTFGRRQNWRPYHYLLVASMTMLVVSLCSSMLPARLEISSRPADTSTVPLPSPTDGGNCANPFSMISRPMDDALVLFPFSIQGTAAGDQFASYRVEIARLTRSEASAPVIWELLAGGGTGNHPVLDGLLVPDSVTANIKTGDYLLRLIVTQEDGNILPPCEVRIRRR